MIRKRVFLVLAVGVLMGTMAVVGLADDQWIDSYGSGGDSSVSSQSEQGMEQQGVEHSDAGEIRESMETGAVPDPSLSPSVPTCCSEGSDPTYWPGGP